MTSPIEAAGRPSPQERKWTTTLVWGALVAMTIIAWRLTPGQSEATRPAGKWLVAAITFLGLVKCRLVIRYFMDVRYAPRWLQAATDAWLSVLWLTLLGIYLS